MSDKKKGTAAGAGLRGAVIGAGIAVAATKILSDAKNRKIVQDKFRDAKKQLSGVLDKAKKRAKSSQKALTEESKVTPKPKSSGQRKKAASKPKK